MAGRDKTGPHGEGPLTGRGMGSCEDKDQPARETAIGPVGRGRALGWGYGQGAGRGFGGGRRYGNGFGFGLGRRYGRGYANFNRNDISGPENEIIDRLTDEIAGLQEKLKVLEDRLDNSNTED